MAIESCDQQNELTLQFRASSGDMVLAGPFHQNEFDTWPGSFISARLLIIDQNSGGHLRSLSGCEIAAYKFPSTETYVFSVPQHDDLDEEAARARIIKQQMPLGVSLITDKSRGNRVVLESPVFCAQETFHDILPYIAPKVLRPHASAILGFAHVLAYELRKPQA